ncbi:E3 SUMO-protein ligase ZBED1-like [Epinephelus fuscoguttatus]|uniref:E3 SUMO-protein ligase ZBED1-like n=1 Tax=Epinephelus fuscoguttatus TaxID=293821 RepID=UPI0020D049FF|nr:E3 SUMO-protein ligase ZBED1-like [Epinephelus fuscoguttatus]
MRLESMLSIICDYLTSVCLLGYVMEKCGATKKQVLKLVKAKLNIEDKAVKRQNQEVRVEEETPEDNARTAAVVTSDTEEDQEKELPPPPPAKRSCTLLENLLGPAFTNQAPEPKSAYARAKDEMAKYRLALTPSLQEDPLHWWSVHQVLYPMITNVAKWYLCIPGSSVSAERVFSTAGDIVTAQCSTLKSEHTDQLLFLHMNVCVPDSGTDDEESDEDE